VQARHRLGDEPINRITRDRPWTGCLRVCASVQRRGMHCDGYEERKGARSHEYSPESTATKLTATVVAVSAPTVQPGREGTAG